MNHRRLKSYGVSVELFSDLIHGDLFRFEGIPHDATVRQITYMYESQAIGILLQSQTFPITPEGEVIPQGGWLEVTRYRKVL